LIKVNQKPLNKQDTSCDNWRWKFKCAHWFWSAQGSSLFLYYINDIQVVLSPIIQLFADDTFAYMAMKPPLDAQHLQQNLNKLAIREGKWKMLFIQTNVTSDLSLKIKILSNLTTPSMVIHSNH